MVEQMLELLIANLGEVLVVGLIAGLLFILNKGRKVLESWLGIQMAEVESWHIANFLYDTIRDNNELYYEVLTLVTDRLERRGIKLDPGELAEIVHNTLKELKQEDGKDE